ncbi:type II toxin-antitoxin system prevent-host-death family antitoxin [Saccharopolyspora erythraea]|uniref:type II toxin-antitoxin system Phd/YefM family antitoxin n=1 Tax=Saccharopolyspora erythraea TaxID=1836 RepID=UPI001BAA4F59|nr:type II toxin-antitoxin system prevent-host-death family antitoxin [Saccharopolyspora erythraea]QUH04459.1 type II toxin-antitoxin system prevent-host-death family antitoxin [Saccharopolyspora erythraea]
MAAEFTIAEAQERLAELIDRAESGEDIVITRFGAPSVRLQATGGRGATTALAGGVVGAAWLAPVAGDAGGASLDSGGASFDVGTDY